MKEITLFKEKIGENHPCFIIAEAGSNHNRSVEIGKQLIDKAKECGVDAVKFQAFKTEEQATRNTKKAAYQEGKSEGDNQFDMIKALELTEEEHKELIDYAKEVGIPLFYSVFDKKSADFVDNFGVPVFKFGSGELTNFPLLKHVAEKGKPIILSTGMGDIEEVKAAVDVIKSAGNDKIILTHCTIGYPIQYKDVNLRAMKTLQENFEYPVGYSDHSLKILVSTMAAAIGAKVIEKHFTLDKNMEGPDHHMSMTPDEMKELVNNIRKIQPHVPVEESNLRTALETIGMLCSGEQIEEILGRSEKVPTEKERTEERVWARKSIVANKDVTAGTVLTGEMLGIKRPGTGIHPKELSNIIGKTAKADIKENDLLKQEDFE